VGDDETEKPQGCDPLHKLAITMNVSVTIELSIPAIEKHWQQMQRTAGILTDSKRSVQVSQPAGNPK